MVVHFVLFWRDTTLCGEPAVGFCTVSFHKGDANCPKCLEKIRALEAKAGRELGPDDFHPNPFEKLEAA
jgi:hypothetical protein